MYSNVCLCKTLGNEKAIFIVLEQQQCLSLCLIYAQEYMLMSSDLGLISLTEFRGQDTRSQQKSSTTVA